MATRRAQSARLFNGSVELVHQLCWNVKKLAVSRQPALAKRTAENRTESSEDGRASVLI